MVRDICSGACVRLIVRRANRAMLAKISAAVLVQTKGAPPALCAAMNSSMAASSARTLRCTLRRSCFVVSSANQRSMRLSQDV